MAGLASGADAAYIYEEPFKIHDLQVCSHDQDTAETLGNEAKSKRSGGLMVIWPAGECRPSGGEDEDHREKRPDPEVLGLQCLYSYSNIYLTLISSPNLPLFFQK